MLTVFKYSVELNDYFTLNLPLRTKILNVDIQYNEFVLWALVNPEHLVTEQRRFRLAGTGHPIVEEATHLEYINTFKMQDGALIFHVFEILKGGVT